MDFASGMAGGLVFSDSCSNRAPTFSVRRRAVSMAGVPDRKECGDQRHRPAIGKPGRPFWRGRVRIRRAPVGHQLGQGTDRPSGGNAATARGEAGCIDKDRPKQGRQSAGTPVLDRSSRATSLAETSFPTKHLGLEPDEALLQAARVDFPSARVSPIVAAEVPGAGRLPLEISCITATPSASVTSSRTRHFIPSPGQLTSPGSYHPQVRDGLMRTRRHFR